MRGVRHIKTPLIIVFFVLLATAVFGATINLVAPANNTWTNGTKDTIVFQFNHTISGNGTTGHPNCSLIIQNATRSYIANTSINLTANTTATAYANATLESGKYKIWWINCTNTTNNRYYISEKRTLTVDNETPKVYLSTPVKDYNVTNTTAVTFNWTPIDNLDTLLICNLTIDGTVNATYNVSSGSPRTHSVYFQNDLIHTWNVTCWDNSTFNGTGREMFTGIAASSSNNTNFTVDGTKPNVTFVNSSVTASTISINISTGTRTNFNGSVFSGPTRVSSCLLMIDGPSATSRSNGTMTYPATANLPNQTNKSVILFSSGKYNFTINCSDTAGNYNDTMKSLIIVNDTIPPTWDQTPYNITLELGDPLGVDFNATDSNTTEGVIAIGDGIDDYSINYTTNAKCNVSINAATGRINFTKVTNNTFPGISNISFNVSVNDTNQNLNTSRRIRVQIVNNTPYIKSWVNSSLTSSSIKVSWNSSEFTNATIKYTTSRAVKTTSSATTVTSYRVAHSLTISGLTYTTKYYYNITVCDRANNCITNGTRNFTTTAAPTVTTTTSSGGSSGIMDTYAVTTTAVAAVPTTASLTKIFDALTTAEDAVFILTNNAIPVTKVTLSLSNDVASGSSLKVSTLESKPVTLADVGATVYKYMEFSKSKMTDSDVSSAVIKFKVPKSWLTSNGLAAEGMALYRFSDGAWNKLPTSMEAENGEDVYYTATTPGFSHFAIAGSTPVSKAAETKAETAPAATTAEAVKEAGSKALLFIVIAIIIAVVLYLVLSRKKKE